jgi:uncharacterized protein (DUF1330 family)
MKTDRRKAGLDVRTLGAWLSISGGNRLMLFGRWLALPFVLAAFVSVAQAQQGAYLDPKLTPAEQPA